MTISKTMHEAIEFAKQNGGTLTRHPGGFWAGETLSEVWFGTSTVQALKQRGLVTYSKWQESSGRPFPIEATLNQLP